MAVEAKRPWGKRWSGNSLAFSSFLFHIPTPSAQLAFPGKLRGINGAATYSLQKKELLLSSVVRLGGQAHLLLSEYFKHTLGKT